jgi:hypothetical protein
LKPARRLEHHGARRELLKRVQPLGVQHERQHTGPRDQPAIVAVSAWRYCSAVEDDVWVELEPDVERVLWAEFAQRFQFRAGVNPKSWPAIVEPAPSGVWDLAPIFESEAVGGFAAGSRQVAALVLGTLQDCVEWPETVAFHDGVHPSLLFRPHTADRPEDVPGWDVGGLFPNGDYTILIGRDFAFGIVGHPWERSLCVFGEPAVAAFARRNRGILHTVLRRDGRPAADRHHDDRTRA